MRSNTARHAACLPFFPNKLTLCVLLGALALSANQATHAAAPLPGGATPGGAQPSLPAPPVATPPAELFPVPPVIERPLDIDEGPMLEVQSFKLEGVVDHPKQGVSAAEVQDLVDAERKKHPKGFTIGRMQEVANAVTKYYRAKGFILAQAYVPAQDVRSGVVVIRVLEGKLGMVEVEGNKLFSTQVISAPFMGLVGKSVTKDALEDAVLRLSDTQGLSAFTVLRPGDQVGETNALVKAQKEDRYQFAVRVDNHGTEFTGDTRLLLDGAINNVSGAGDVLSATLVNTSRPSNSLYGDMRYQRPAYHPGAYWGLSVSKNRFEVGEPLDALGLEGDTSIAELFLRDAFVRSRERNLYGNLSFAVKRADLTENSNDFTSDKLSVLGVEVNYDDIDTRYHGINQLYASVSHGFPDLFGAMGDQGDGSVPSSRRGGSLEYAGGDFDKLQVGYTRWQNLARNHSLLLRMQGQYSNDLLTSLEQFAMGGPESVRAYPVSEFLMDKAYFLSLEYVANAPGFSDKPAFKGRTWGELLQFSVFFDTASGWLKDPLPAEDDHVTLSGVGVGAQLTMAKRFDAKLTVAKPTTSRDPSNGHDPQVFLNMRYEF